MFVSLQLDEGVLEIETYSVLSGETNFGEKKI